MLLLSNTNTWMHFTTGPGTEYQSRERDLNGMDSKIFFGKARPAGFWNNT